MLVTTVCVGQVLEGKAPVVLVVQWWVQVHFVTVEVHCENELVTGLLFLKHGTPPMAMYFLIDRSGTPIYSATASSLADDRDRARIHFLPLFALQDLMRSTFGERFRYVRMGGRTVVFCELEELHYIAASSHLPSLPPSISLLDSHLHTFHHTLRFKLGPRFPALLHAPTSTNTTRVIVTVLLSRLTRNLTAGASGALAAVEQVELKDDLRKRCKDIVTDACDAVCGSGGSPVRRRVGSGAGRTGLGMGAMYAPARAGWLNAMVFLGKKLLIRCQSTGGGSGYGLGYTEAGFELCPEDLFAVMVHVEGFLEEAKDSAAQQDSIPEPASRVIGHKASTPQIIHRTGASAQTPTSSSAFHTPSSASSSDLSYTPPQTTAPATPTQDQTPDSGHDTDTDTLINRVVDRVVDRVIDRASAVLLSVQEPLQQHHHHHHQNPVSPGAHRRERPISMAFRDVESDEEGMDGRMEHVWVRSTEGLIPCRLFAGSVGEGMVIVVVCHAEAGDPPPTSHLHRMRTLQHRVRRSLTDFSSFLLIKAATHFSLLSRAVVAYPGLVHYVFLTRGVVLEPRVVELRRRGRSGEGQEVDAMGGLEGGEEEDDVAREGPWGWLTVAEMKRTILVLLHLAHNFRTTTQHQGPQFLQPPAPPAAAAPRHGGLHYVYARDPRQDHELFALYLDVVPPAEVASMHDALAGECKRGVW